MIDAVREVISSYDVTTPIKEPPPQLLLDLLEAYVLNSEPSRMAPSDLLTEIGVAHSRCNLTRLGQCIASNFGWPRLRVRLGGKLTYLYDIG